MPAEPAVGPLITFKPSPSSDSRVLFKWNVFFPVAGHLPDVFILVLGSYADTLKWVVFITSATGTWQKMTLIMSPILVLTTQVPRAPAHHQVFISPPLAWGEPPFLPKRSTPRRGLPITSGPALLLPSAALSSLLEG